MGNYSKLIGSIVGGIAGILVAKGLLPDSLASADVQSAFVVLLSAVSTYLFPANKPAA